MTEIKYNVPYLERPSEVVETMTSIITNNNITELESVNAATGEKTIIYIVGTQVIVPTDTKLKTMEQTTADQDELIAELFEERA